MYTGVKSVELFFAATTKSFDPVCCLCAAVAVYEGPETQALKEQFGTVRPICKECLDLGKQPMVRCAVKVAKKKRAR